MTSRNRVLSAVVVTLVLGLGAGPPLRLHNSCRHSRR